MVEEFYQNEFLGISLRIVASLLGKAELTWQVLI